MSNYGDIFLTLHDPSDLANVLHTTDNGRDVYYLYALDADGEQVLDGIGNGSATVALWDRDANPHIQRGRIARVYVYSAKAGGNLEIATFIITEVNIQEPEGNNATITISGPDLLAELQRRKVTQTVIGGRHSGTAGAATATTIYLDGSASSIDDYYNGAEIEAGGSTGIITDYIGATKQAILDAGWNPSTPANGSAFTVYKGKALDDVTQAISHAPTGWAATETGTAEGTKLVVTKHTVLDALAEIATQAGEHFRLEDQYPPTRSVKWLRTADAGTVSLVHPDNYTGSVGEAVITAIQRVTEEATVTRAYVYGGGSGQDQLTLNGITAGDVDIPAGFSVDFTNSLITHTAAEAGLHESQRVETDLEFPNIRAESDSYYDLKDARKELFYAAITELQNHANKQRTYDISCVAHREIRPGQSLSINFSESTGGEELWSISGTIYALRVKHSVKNGIRYTQITAADALAPGTPNSGPAKTAAILKQTRDAIRNSGPQPGNTVISGDISAAIASHADVDDAHHAPITLGTLAPAGGLTLSGQELGLNLDLSDLHPAATAGHGIEVDGNQVISAKPASPSAIKADANGLAIDETKIGSGLTISSQTIDLNTPKTISTTSTNVVSGGHRHQVNWSSSTESNALLGTSQGRLSVMATQTLWAMGLQDGPFRIFLGSGSQLHHAITHPNGSITVNVTGDGTPQTFNLKNLVNGRGDHADIASGLTNTSVVEVIFDLGHYLDHFSYAQWTPFFATRFTPNTSGPWCHPESITFEASTDGSTYYAPYITNAWKTTAYSSNTKYNSAWWEGVNANPAIVSVRYIKVTLTDFYIGTNVDYGDTLWVSTIGLHMAPQDTSPHYLNAVTGGYVTGSITLDTNGINVHDTTRITNGQLWQNGNLRFYGAGTIDSETAGSLTITPGADLILSPADELRLNPTSEILVMSDRDLSAEGWSSGFLGSKWGIDTSAGHLDIRSIYTDELRATRFLIETATAKAGALWITPGASTLTRDFTIPAVSASGTLYVEDSPGLPNIPVFSDDDYILIRIFKYDGTTLQIANVWGQVTNYTDLGSSSEQTWTFTTRELGAASAGDTAPTGTPALGFGNEGAGYWHTTTMDAAGSPYTAITTWEGNPYEAANRTEHIRLGQLDGLSGLGHQWGLFAGRKDGRHVIASDETLEAHGLKLSLYTTQPDDLQLRLNAINMMLYYHTGATPAGTLLAPNGDGSKYNIQYSSGSTAYNLIWDDPTSPNTTNYIYNATNGGGTAFITLTDTPANFAWGTDVSITAHSTLVNTGNDRVRITVQIFKSDEETPLTDHGIIATETTNGAQTVKLRVTDRYANKAVWDAAKLRISWHYSKEESGTETIQLDPDTPAIKVGSSLPTGTDAGGDGIFLGYDSSAYTMRIGGTSTSEKPRLVWTGTALEFRNGASNDPLIALDNTGASYFGGTMTIGTSGSIQQFDGSGNGIKLHSNSGAGRLTAYGESAVEVRNIDGDAVGFLQGIKYAANFDPNNDTIALKADNSGGAATALIANASGGNTGIKVTQGTTDGEIRFWIDGAGPLGPNIKFTPQRTEFYQDNVWIEGALALGWDIYNSDDPDNTPAGTLLLKERGSISKVTNGCILFCYDNSGSQELRVLFDNGQVRTLATQ